MDKQKRSLALRIVLLSALAAWMIISAYVPELPGLCPVQRFLHLRCPGCGMSRALAALLRLDFAGALRYNLMAPLILGYLLYVCVSWWAARRRGGQDGLLPKPEWLNVVFLIVFLAWFSVRNVLGL